MKSNMTLLLGMALTITAGMLAVNASGLLSHNDANSVMKAGTYMTGHVETVVTDSDGNVKAYRQSDNIVTNAGENCAARLLFRTEGVSGSGSGACTGALTHSWNVIAIGNGTTVANGTDVRLVTEHNVSGLTRLAATGSNNVLTNTTASTPASSATVVLKATFTNSGTTSQDVSESGLFNGTTYSGSTESMFARQKFNTISLNPSDQLSVQWTINIGGTQNTLTQNQ